MQPCRQGNRGHLYNYPQRVYSTRFIVKNIQFGQEYTCIEYFSSLLLRVHINTVIFRIAIPMKNYFERSSQVYSKYYALQ